MVGANQPVHWFLGGKGLDIQQGTSVWVGLPKSILNLAYQNKVKEVNGEKGKTRWTPGTDLAESHLISNMQQI